MAASQETHEGKIVEIDNHSIKVQIRLQEACQHCENKKSCILLSSEKRIIDIECLDFNDYHVGETVLIKMDTSLGLQAVCYAYVLPLVFLLTAIFTGSYFISKDILVVLLALAFLAIYYTILYFNKHRIKRKFSFRMLKKNDC